MNRIKQKGFSLVELLVVLAIIGLLSTLAVISLSGIREKGRDIKRVNIVDSVVKAMDIIWSESADFSDVGCASGNVYACTGGDLETYIPTIANLKDPSSPTVNCNASCDDVCEITFDEVSEDSYEFYFYLEKGVPNTYYEDAGCYLVEMSEGEKSIGPYLDL